MNVVRCRDRLGYTLVCLAIFLVCSQLPLYGVKTTAGSDPFYWARVIMASSRGTVMELGIGPTITAGLVTQLLSGSKIIDVDYSVKGDRELVYVCHVLCGGDWLGTAAWGGWLGSLPTRQLHLAAPCEGAPLVLRRVGRDTRTSPDVRWAFWSR